MARTEPVHRRALRSLALLPGAALALLPSATCPACIAAYAGVLSALGLGFLHDERVVAPLIGGFLVVGIASIAWATRSHQNLGPLGVTVVGSAGVVVSRLLWNVPAALYASIAVLIAASVWNLWLKRQRRAPVFQLQVGSGGPRT